MSSTKIHTGGFTDYDEILSDGQVIDFKTEDEFRTHPVTKVYCTAHGLIGMERFAAPPIILGATSPKDSRKTALRRTEALLRPFFGDETHPGRKMAVSDGGMGLTFNELRRQVFEACKISKQIESRQEARAKEKRIRYKI